MSKFSAGKQLFCVMSVLAGCGDETPPEMPKKNYTLNVTLPPGAQKVEVSFDETAAGCVLQLDKSSATCTLEATAVHKYAVSVLESTTEGEPAFGCRLAYQTEAWPPDAVTITRAAKLDRQCKVSVLKGPGQDGTFYLNPGMNPYPSPQYFAPDTELQFLFVATVPGSGSPKMLVRPSKAGDCEGTGNSCVIRVYSATEITVFF